MKSGNTLGPDELSRYEDVYERLLKQEENCAATDLQ